MADSKLKIDIRRSKILDALRRDGRVSVARLSQELGATTVTIRNDLTALERDGYLLRVQGGGVLAARPDMQGGAASAVDAPEISCAAQKQAIAEAIARLVPDGSTLFLNSGTTTRLVAAALKARRGLNIVTNSVAVALELGAVPSFHVLLIGGEVNVHPGFTYGGDAQEQLKHYHADWVILSIDGICAEGGVSTYLMEEAVIDRIMLDQAKRRVIAADHTKVGRAGFTSIRRNLSGLTLVTDAENTPETLADLEAAGVEIIVS